jgi:hypothetical protein
MLIFVLVALTTLAIFQLLTLLRPVIVQVSLYREIAYGILVVLLPIFVIAFSGWAYFNWHYPNYGLRLYVIEVLLDRYASSIILGMAAGVTFGVLLNSITLAPLHRPLTTKHKLLLGFLLSLLLLGIGGEQLLRDVSRRVSKLSFGGAEVAFFDPAQSRRGRPEGDPSLAVGFGSPTANGAAISLELFKVFPDLIYRDKANIEAAAAKDHAPPGSTDKVVADLDEADRLTQIMIAPFGECLLEIFGQTGDIDFVRTNLTLLLQPLRDLAPQVYRDPRRFALAGAAATTKLLQHLFIFAYDRAYVHDNKRINLQNRDPDADSKNLGARCRKLAYVLCSPDPWTVKRIRIQRVVGSTRRAVEQGKPLDGASLETLFAKVFATNNPALVQCHRIALESRQRSSGRVQSEFERQISPILEGFAARKDFYNRPYTAIMLAGILAQLGLYESALVQLDDWAQRQKSSTRETMWFKVRALNISIYLTEYWIRRESTNASIILRDFHLNRQNQALSLVDKLFDFKTEVRQARHGMAVRDFIDTAFSRPPTETDRCSRPDISGVPSQKRLYYWYVVLSAQVAQHRLLHPEYAKEHSPHANQAITELLSTDLGCAAFPEGEKTAFRAWLLRLFATMQLQDAIALKAAKSRPSREALLQNGTRAADLALKMIRGKAERDLAEKRTDTSQPLLRRLALTPEIDEYEALLRLLSQLSEAQHNFD